MELILRPAELDRTKGYYTSNEPLGIALFRGSHRDMITVRKSNLSHLSVDLSGSRPLDRTELESIALNIASYMRACKIFRYTAIELIRTSDNEIATSIIPMSLMNQSEQSQIVYRRSKPCIFVYETLVDGSMGEYVGVSLDGSSISDEIVLRETDDGLVLSVCLW